jgi:hypothetical protein
MIEASAAILGLFSFAIFAAHASRRLTAWGTDG